MDSATFKKRGAPSLNLYRRVRARRDEPEPDPFHDFGDEDQDLESSEDDEEESGGGSEEEEEGDSNEESGSSSEDEEAEDPSAAASQISFGALAKAQASLPSIRRGKGRPTEEEEDESESDSDQPDSEPKDKSKLPTPHRAHKHAPTEQTSKRPVTRRREVVPIARRAARDPRFSSATSTRPEDEARSRRAYGFLDEYRDSEMGALRAAARKTRDPGAREELKRAVASMESRRKAQQRRDDEAKMLADHRRRERDLVRQGKQPFYLKKSEQKRRLLVDRFEGLKPKQVDRTIERRRKKLASKEKKNMPMPRARRDAAES
ncbi:DUF947-domain-containing protein [Hypoxylon sp. FL1284]|nr:DUF947-domain-containing protein [Hypoxylon sp. FL1284]